MAISTFPGQDVGIGAEAAVVSAIQQRMLALGYGPFNEAVFDENMKSIAMLFQAQHSGAQNMPLVINGDIDRQTWVALFGADTSAVMLEANELEAEALRVATEQIGQMESPLGSNTGPMVDKYLRSVGIDPNKGSPDDRYWCMAFVYWCFEQASEALGTSNRLPKTGGCLKHWREAKNIDVARIVLRKDAYRDPTLLNPGMIFIMDFGEGYGHTGIVREISPDGSVRTVEGNTNAHGTRTGVGVFDLRRRTLSDKMIVGFISYSLE